MTQSQPFHPEVAEVGFGLVWLGFFLLVDRRFAITSVSLSQCPGIMTQGCQESFNMKSHGPSQP